LSGHDKAQQGPVRSAFIDNIKGIACLLIVFHHLAFYGPMSDVANAVIPDIIDFFFDYARLAVAVFLCIGGFLTGLKLCEPNFFAKHSVQKVIWQKYLRLVIPYLGAIALAIAASFVASRLMQHHSISAMPDAPQLLSHLLFLQNILGYESLSAGLWYVAIDFQLFSVCALLVFLVEKVSPASWSYRSTRLISLIIFSGLTITSAMYFNLYDAYDVWFFYFFASYGLGLLAACLARNQTNRVLILSVVAVTIFSLYYQDFRERLLIALLMAFLLFGSYQSSWSQSKIWKNPLRKIGEMSYSIFLVHFPVSLVISGIWVKLYPSDPWMNVLGMGLSALLSLLLAIPFYKYIEKN
jgi:peptidoglycan/LPS O-acetylase OafA/YrhL